MGRGNTRGEHMWAFLGTVLASMAYTRITTDVMPSTFKSVLTWMMNYLITLHRNEVFVVPIKLHNGRKKKTCL